MTIIRHDLVSGSLVDETMPRIGYANLFREGTVTASSEAAGHPKELAYDGLTYDAWQSTGGATESLQVQKGSSTPADYMAVLGGLSGCTLTPQRSSNGSDWTNLHAPYLAPDDRPIVWEWTAVSDLYWRLLVESAPGQVSIRALQAGVKLTLAAGLPVGFAPPSLNEDVSYTNSMSEGGQMLGRSVVRKGVAADVESRHIDYTFARADWMSFIEAANRYAVFFWWTYQGYAEVMYGGVESYGGSFSTEAYVTTKFKLKGMIR